MLKSLVIIAQATGIMLHCAFFRENYNVKPKWAFIFGWASYISFSNGCFALRCISIIKDS